jgi:hypothetical protein
MLSKVIKDKPILSSRRTLCKDYVLRGSAEKENL